MDETTGISSQQNAPQASVQSVNMPAEPVTPVVPVTSSVQSSVKYAGFWRRFVGWLIDILILIILGHWISLPFSSALTSKILSVIAQPSVSVPQLFSIVAELALLNFIVIAIYYCLLEASPLQATVGKYIVGIQITDMEGRRISYGRALLRRVYTIISAIPLFIGYFVAGFTSKKQTFHDMFAQTVVVIKNKKSGWMLVLILIITIIVGILSNKFLGAGFNFTFNSPTSHYDTQGGLQNYTVVQGDQVDPALQNEIINAFNSSEAIYNSGNLSEIRQHLISAEPTQAQAITSMSDTDLQNYVAFQNKIAGMIGTSTAVLTSHDATWTFNQGTTTVQISTAVPLPSGQTETVRLDGVYVNNQWNF